MQNFLTLNNPTTLGALLLVVLGLLKIIEYLVKKIFSSHKSVLTHEEKEYLKHLFEIHNKCDEDGVLLCYVPRSFAKVQVEVIRAMSKVTIQQEKITYILEQLVKQIDKLEDKE